LIFLTVISGLITASMGFVVFGELAANAGHWDDLALVAASLVFLWSSVRILRDRAVEQVDQARRLDTLRRSLPGGRDSRCTDAGQA